MNEEFICRHRNNIQFKKYKKTIVIWKRDCNSTHNNVLKNNIVVKQDNRILAELDYPRTTGSGATSTSVIGPSIYSISNAVVTSPSCHVLPNIDSALGITGNLAPANNVSDLASSALGSWTGPRLTTTNAQQQINNLMPSISQV